MFSKNGRVTRDVIYERALTVKPKTGEHASNTDSSHWQLSFTVFRRRCNALQSEAEFLPAFASSGRNDIESAVEVDTAARLCQLLCYENKDQLMAGLIVGGWDKRVRFLVDRD